MPSVDVSLLDSFWSSCVFVLRFVKWFDAKRKASGVSTRDQKKPSGRGVC